MALTTGEVGSAVLGAMIAVAVSYVASGKQLADTVGLASHQEYERACVRRFNNGWSYDPCEAEALRKLKQSDESLQRCIALTEKADFDPDEFEKACGSGKGAALDQ